MEIFAFRIINQALKRNDNTVEPRISGMQNSGNNLRMNNLLLSKNHQISGILEICQPPRGKTILERIGCTQFLTENKHPALRDDYFP